MWTHAGRRGYELLRLRVGCSQPRGEDVVDGAGKVTPAGTLCCLHAPPGKTGSAYVKPVTGVVRGHAAAWEANRPVQDLLLDERTGQQVSFLFQFRGRRAAARPRASRRWGRSARACAAAPGRSGKGSPRASPSAAVTGAGNGCAERFIRTLEEDLPWVRTFDTVGQPRQALIEFRGNHNARWLIARHGFRPAAAIRAGQLPTAAPAA